MCGHPILDTRTSFARPSVLCVSRSGDPPCILKRLDWRALIELCIPNIGKLREAIKKHDLNLEFFSQGGGGVLTKFITLGHIFVSQIYGFFFGENTGGGSDPLRKNSIAFPLFFCDGFP